MSAARTPDPDEHPERCALSDRDLRILDEIADRECGADPSFAARMRGPLLRMGPDTERALQILVVAGVVTVLAPDAWPLIAVAAVVAGSVTVLLGWIRRNPV